MFTGIVEAMGRVEEFGPRGDSTRIRVSLPFGNELVPGESVAVDGCCLTALPGCDGDFVADLSPETLACTTFHATSAGQHVNLERALSASARLGGHIVQGHVDGVSELVSSVVEGEGSRLRFSLREEEQAFYVPKGSIAVNGVSLTVAALGEDWFEVCLIPHTLAETTLGELSPGDPVNIEHDLVGKYLLRSLALSGRVDLPAAARKRLGVD